MNTFYIIPIELEGFKEQQGEMREFVQIIIDVEEGDITEDAN